MLLPIIVAWHTMPRDALGEKLSERIQGRMLPYWFIFLAIGIRVLSGFGYIRSIFRGLAKPNPITWFIWSLTAFIAFFAQVRVHVGTEALVTLAIGISPLIICILGVIKSPSASHFTFFSVTCGILALLGIVFWQLTSNPLTAIMCSILADACGGLPTIRKAYQQPQSEDALPYFLSICSMALTLATITSWRFANYAFPAYILLINAVIFSTITWRNKVLVAVPVIARPQGKPRRQSKSRAA